VQKKYAKAKEVNRMERMTKNMTEYRQPGGDADGVGGYGVGTGMMAVGMGTKYFTVSSSSQDVV